MGEKTEDKQVTLDLETKKPEEEKPQTTPATEQKKTEKLLPPLLATTICTIGYTQKSAKIFFKLLTEAGVKVLIDIRANASFQTSGYTLRRDLGYFCELHGIQLVVLNALAPSQEIRHKFGKAKDWAGYEKAFIAMLNKRKAFSDKDVRKVLFEQDPEGAICFLCAEPTADQCHRRLVVEHLLKFLPNADQITVRHL